MAFDGQWAFRTCGYCGLKRAQMNIVLAHHQAIRPDGKSLWHTLLQCPDCAHITMIQHNGPTAKPSDNKILEVYPGDADRALDVKHLPESVRQYYLDAKRVLDAGVPDAAAVQLRRTLEAAVAEFPAAKQKTLMRSIEKLIEDGLVTKQFGQALHHIRSVGNVGAHATDERVDDPTAERALEFTTQLLRNLFEVPGELSLIAGGEDQENTDDAQPVSD
jgi:hypothetical protein